MHCYIMNAGYPLARGSQAAAHCQADVNTINVSAYGSSIATSTDFEGQKSASKNRAAMKLKWLISEASDIDPSPWAASGTLVHAVLCKGLLSGAS